MQQLWDYYYLVMGTIESWKKSPWKKIDADGMDQECKRFTKDLRQLDKEMRAWYVVFRLIGSFRSTMNLWTYGYMDISNAALEFSKICRYTKTQSWPSDLSIILNLKRSLLQIDQTIIFLSIPMVSPIFDF